MKMSFFRRSIGRTPFLEEVQCISDLLSLTPLDPRGSTIPRSIVRIAFFLFVTVLSLVPVFLLYERAYYSEVPDSNSKLYLSLSYFVTWLIFGFIFIDISCSMSELRRMVRIVSKVDLFLWQMASRCKKRSSFFWTATAIRFFFSIVTACLQVYNFSLQYNFSLHKSLFAGVCLLTLCIIGDLSTRKFTVMVHFIERRLTMLEDLLKETWIQQETGWRQDVKRLLQAHDHLCDSCAILNSAWNGALVAIVINIFAGLVRTSVTNAVRIKNHGFDPNFIKCTACVPISWLWSLYDITHYTQRCESQVQAFNTTLYCLVMSNSRIRYDAEPDFLDLLLVQLGRKRKVAFMAHGLFPVNNTLAHMIIAGVFTTVIIIIQTEHPST